MSAQQPTSHRPRTARRTFLQSTVAAATALAASRWLNPPHVHAAGNEAIRIGMIGCGGRCSGAADQALSLGTDVKLVAMSDVFQKRMQEKRELFRDQVSRSVSRHGRDLHVRPGWIQAGHRSQ